MLAYPSRDEVDMVPFFLRETVHFLHELTNSSTLFAERKRNIQLPLRWTCSARTHNRAEHARTLVASSTVLASP